MPLFPGELPPFPRMSGQALTTVVSATAVPPKPSCSGTVHTITSSDTCVSISMGEGISTEDLTGYNELPSYCNYFPNAGTQLCIPDTRKCKPHKIGKNDTCTSLQSQLNIKYGQLVSWNPSIGTRCSNIKNLIGLIICASNPGGDWVNPSPSITTSITSTV